MNERPVRSATLYDDLAQKRFDLSSLANAGVRTISLGRGRNMQVKIGEDCESKKVGTASKSHASISYDEELDTFTYVDKSSNGSAIKRKGKSPIILNEDHSSEVLENGDQIYLSERVEKGYGPLMFRQCEKDSNKEGLTQKIE